MKRDKWTISLCLHDKVESRHHLKMWWVWQHCYMDAVFPKLTSRCDGFGSIVTWTLSSPNWRSTDAAGKYHTHINTIFKVSSLMLVCIFKLKINLSVKCWFMKPSSWSLLFNFIDDNVNNLFNSITESWNNTISDLEILIIYYKVQCRMYKSACVTLHRVSWPCCIVIANHSVATSQNLKP